MSAEDAAADETAYAYAFRGMAGEDVPLSAFQGKVLLVVNTASKCGLTPQYQGLEKLWNTYRDKGLVVLGVPSGSFMGQEFKSEGEIKGFCELNYGVDFPLTAKHAVKGKNAHPFYAWAKRKLGKAGEPRWNFHKILIGRDGRPIAGFGALTRPEDPKILAAVEAAL